MRWEYILVTISVCMAKTQVSDRWLLMVVCVNYIFRYAANAAALSSITAASTSCLLRRDLSSGKVDEDLLQRRLTH